MKGAFIESHYLINLTESEGASLRRVMEDLRKDDGFHLNEFEEEIVSGILEALDPPDRSGDELPIG